MCTKTVDLSSVEQKGQKGTRSGNVVCVKACTSAKYNQAITETLPKTFSQRARQVLAKKKHKRRFTFSVIGKHHLIVDPIVSTLKLGHVQNISE